MASPLEAMADAGDGEDDGEGEGPNPESIDAAAMPPLALHSGRERWVGRLEGDTYWVEGRGPWGEPRNVKRSHFT